MLVETAQQEEHTFLKQLYDHAQRHTTPVVDEEFIKTFSSLSWEEQCRAMNHLYWIKQNKDRAVNNHEEVVYKGRVEQLYETWLEDQTETFVGLYYTPPMDTLFWVQETLDRVGKQKTVSLEEARERLEVNV